MRGGMRVIRVKFTSVIEVVSGIRRKQSRRDYVRPGSNPSEGQNIVGVSVVVQSVDAVIVLLEVTGRTEVLGRGRGRIGGLRSVREQLEKRLVHRWRNADEIGGGDAARDCFRRAQECFLEASKEEQLVFQYGQAQ